MSNAALKDSGDVLRDFGAALERELTKANMSLANFAKHTAGISKNDVRDFIAGTKAPDKLTIKKVVHCFPALMAFEHALRHTVASAPAKVEKPQKPRPEPKSETRLKVARPVFVPPQTAPRPVLVPPKPRVEIVTQHQQPAPTLSHQPFVQALKRTRAEMLTDLASMVKKRLANHDAEDYDFTIKNSGTQMLVRLQVEEKGAEDLVDSGCYVSVTPHATSELAVFCKAMTGGHIGDTMPRVLGAMQILEIAKMLHDTVKDRRFE